MSLAPIGITTYVRLSHLMKTVEALRKNTLAEKSLLYIFSDAAIPGDEDKVIKLREFIHAIDGFKEVYVVERKHNGRVENGRGGLKQLLDQYGKVIFLEEDIVTAPGFLEFMNSALDYYENDPGILSIAGYCPPIRLPKGYSKDIFILQRFNGWGYATWSDKFDPFDYDVRKEGADSFFSDERSIKAFSKNGEDMYHMLRAEYNHEIDALDVKLMFYEFVSNMFTVYPSKSLVQNIGHDGSGIHCLDSDKFRHEKLWKKTDGFIFYKDIQVDEYIRNENYWFRSIDYKRYTPAAHIRRFRDFIMDKFDK